MNIYIKTGDHLKDAHKQSKKLDWVCKTMVLKVSRNVSENYGGLQKAMDSVTPSPNMKWRMAGLILALIVFWPSVSVCTEKWSGKCVGISDGDTIRVLRGSTEVKVRLYGIDSPELGQDFGAKARAFTGRKAFGKTVIVEDVVWDQYGRLVAWVWVNEQSLNKELVKAGLAWWYKYFAPRDRELRTLEARARKEKLGLWSHSDPIPPWEFRRQTKDY